MLYISISTYLYIHISLVCIDVVCTAAVRKAPKTRVTPQKNIEHTENICINVSPGQDFLEPRNVNQTVSQPEARPQCTHLHFFISLCFYVIGESGRNHIGCSLQSNSFGSSYLTPCISAS